nr:hypothetical protein [uncultured Desulfobulbus sp.]
MKRKFVLLFCLMVTLSLPMCCVIAAERTTVQEIRGNQEPQVYGSQLMTHDERVEYQRQMREAKTAEERTSLRQKHHQRMQERAAVRGVTLPEDPPSRGGMGMGAGGDGMMNGGDANR